MVTRAFLQTTQETWKRQAKRVWRTISESPTARAVLILDSKIRDFPFTVEVGEMMADFPDQTVGVFDARHGYVAFLEDVLFTVKRLERVLY